MKKKTFSELNANLTLNYGTTLKLMKFIKNNSNRLSGINFLQNSTCFRMLVCLDKSSLRTMTDFYITIQLMHAQVISSGETGLR